MSWFKRHLMKAKKLFRYNIDYSYFIPKFWGTDPHGSLNGNIGHILRAQATSITEKALWQSGAYTGINDKYYLIEGMQDGDILGVGRGNISAIQFTFTRNGIIHIDSLDGQSCFVVWNDTNPGARDITVKPLIIL